MRRAQLARKRSPKRRTRKRLQLEIIFALKPSTVPLQLTDEALEALWLLSE